MVARSPTGWPSPEQFGMNIRATCRDARAELRARGGGAHDVGVSVLFQFGRGYLGTQGSGLAVGVVAILVALVALTKLEDTYGKDVNYVDH